MKTPEILVCLFIIATVAWMAIDAMAKAHRKPRERGKHLGLVMVALLFASSVGAAPVGGTPDRNPRDAGATRDVYAAGQIGLTPFASYRVHEFDSLDGEMGVGLAASYALTRNLTLEVWTLSEGYESAPVIDSLTEAGANVKFYAPIKESGFAPYALLGYSRGIHTAANNMELGAGLEYRFAKHLTAFTDGVWIQNFGLEDPVSYAHVKFRAGLGWRF